VTPSDMKEALTQLGLSAAAQALEQIQARAVAGQITYAEFLADLLQTEQADRRTRYLDTRMKLANLPFHKRLDDFDFSLQPTIDERQIQELATLSFIPETSNIFFVGAARRWQESFGSFTRFAFN
jgi:DNA replication protein DnaC